MLPARFLAKVVAVPHGCHYWIGAIADDGYGRWTSADGRTVTPHRWLWEQIVGPIPAELQSPDLVYFAGIPTASAQAGPARALIDFLAGFEAAPIIKSKGLEPR